MALSSWSCHDPIHDPMVMVICFCSNLFGHFYPVSLFELSLSIHFLNAIISHILLLTLFLLILSGLCPPHELMQINAFHVCDSLDCNGLQASKLVRCQH